MKLPRFKYVSYYYSTLQDRLVVMYYTDMEYGKGKYELLENMNLKDKVLIEDKIKYVELEIVLIEAEKAGKS